MLLVQSDFDYIHVNTLASYDFCDVLVYCLKYEQLTFHWFSHRWIKYFWNDMGNIYIRLDSNTTRYTRHKLHLLTLTIHLYLNYSRHNFIKAASCVVEALEKYSHIAQRKILITILFKVHCLLLLLWI